MYSPLLSERRALIVIPDSFSDRTLKSLNLSRASAMFHEAQEKIHKTHNGPYMEYYWEYQSSH